MIKKVGLNTKPRKYKMKEWENKAIDVIKEAKATIKKDPESYPLGWEEIAVYNLQAQMKNRGIDNKDDRCRCHRTCHKRTTLRICHRIK